jgi:hypothetical protein
MYNAGEKVQNGESFPSPASEHQKLTIKPHLESRKGGKHQRFQNSITAWSSSRTWKPNKQPPKEPA